MAKCAECEATIGPKHQSGICVTCYDESISAVYAEVEQEKADAEWIALVDAERTRWLSNHTAGTYGPRSR